MQRKLLITTSIATLFLAHTAMAQTAFDGANASDLNEDLREEIEDDFERDLGEFGNEGRPLGFSGSAAVRATAASGNSDNADVGIGTDLIWYDGTNGVSLELNYAYGETDGTKTEESLFYDLEYTRDLTPRVFAFATVQGTVDEFSAFETDTFVGFGAGYRIYDTSDIQWTVQGGPGYRVADLDAAVDGDFEEGAIVLESNYLNRLSDTMYVTNDTDVVWSESDTVVLNDLGLNVSMTETLALRTSVETEYHTDPQPGFKSTDNTFGVSLVYNFE
ncbi:DUF481 domain-containing protein [Alphaproteobacteria bacterium GH1-50]|uniref:DUF481 domain-containing protein n=1 Tax=Kangsaoukella pontilimi TaxID=2691042 RepID=A0A7C9MEQ9_9RHOB|nr:DUF481 domain-containing protein [Kangsaoukella pontilimi]MXQ07236.1 DUF481 domain-containing protein [Kangsaoukella pontilimi]